MNIKYGIIIKLLLAVIFFCITFAEAQNGTKSLIDRVQELLDERKPQEAIDIISGYKPDSSSLHHYYYLYGKALRMVKKLPLAIEKLTLAYIYSKGDIKEASLLERADAYFEMGYYYESMTNYSRFIKEFPNSKDIRQAYKGLANSLFKIGLYRDALRYYELSGDEIDVLVSKANTLQMLGMTKEANDLYKTVLSKDSEYMKRFDDTLYYLGENLRQTNNIAEARRYLSLIQDNNFKYRAAISLGLIALNESNLNAASKYFNLALFSKERKVKRQALFYLSDINIRLKKIDKAIENLEEIRYRHPYGEEYYGALLRLSSLYKDKGDFKKSLSLLKEIMFSRSSLKREAIDTLSESMVSMISKDIALFYESWKSLGRWLLDTTKEENLLMIADALQKNSETPAMEIYFWLSKNGSDFAKSKSLVAITNFYVDIGEIKKAEEYMSLLNDKKVSKDDIRRIESRVLYAKGSYDPALERLLLISNPNEKDLEMIRRLSLHNRDIKKALMIYEKVAKDSKENVDVYLNLADLYYDAGKFNDALNYYRHALTLEPSNEWAIYRISHLERSMGDKEILKKIKKDKILANISNLKIKEIDINKKIREIF